MTAKASRPKKLKRKRSESTPAKASRAKQLKRKRSESTTLLKDLIESKVANEKERIDDINAKFSSKRKDIFKTFNMKEAETYLRKERKSYDSFVAKFDKKAGHLESTKTQLRKEIAKNALKKFPGLKEITRLNSQNIAHLHNALHPGATGDFDSGLIADPEVVLPDVSDFDVFEPPYELWEADNVGQDFDEDTSLPWADWGTLHHVVQYSDDHSWTDSQGRSQKYAHNSVAVGVNYRMPKHGALDITLVLTNFENQIDYSITDNFFTSNASVVIENYMLIPISSGGNLIYTHTRHMIFESEKSYGENKSGLIHPVPTNTPRIINFRTDHIHGGVDVQIMIASWLAISSNLYRMKAKINATLLWKVDKIYAMVV